VCLSPCVIFPRFISCYFLEALNNHLPCTLSSIAYDEAKTLLNFTEAVCRVLLN
jgi:hypothetical protein